MSSQMHVWRVIDSTDMLEVEFRFWVSTAVTHLERCSIAFTAVLFAKWPSRKRNQHH